jgi:diguanylate cyclase (GGDEF)-like protein/PAS domain S-box-containing protein
MSVSPPESGSPSWTEADRLAALRSFHVLDTEPEAVFDEITASAARICNAPMALVSLVDDVRHWFKCEVGAGEREIPRGIGICGHTILQSGVFIVPDTTKDSRFADNPLVTGKPHLRFYAGAPLVTDDGLPLGTLCVLDDKPRPEGLTPEQSTALLDLARAVMTQLKLRRAEKAHEENEARLKRIIDAVPHIVWSALPNGHNDFHNQRWYEFSGLPLGSAIGEQWSEILHPDDQDRTWAKWRHSLATGEPYEVEYRLRHHSGEYRWALGRAVPLRNEQGEIERWLGTCTDIHEAKQAEVALAESEERYRALIEASTAMVWRAAPDGSILQGWGWKEFAAQAPKEYEGHGWLNVVHPDDREQVVAVWQELLAQGRSGEVEYRVLTKSGEYRWVLARGVPLKADDGAVREWVGTITDIHDEKQAEERLWWLANHDPLTGLPSRTLFQARLSKALAETEQNRTPVCLLLIDLDDFKDVNDSFGHDAGDALLKETARRLFKMVTACDTAARLGGDEFAVLLTDPSLLDQGVAFAESIIKSLNQPLFSYAGQSIATRASIGMAMYPDHAAEPAELLKAADIALYRSKAAGRNRVTMYAPAMRVATALRITLRREMREALSQDQIVPYYQPQVCLATGAIIGFEALARWHHPTQGLLIPSTFGAAFDDVELATLVGQRLIGTIAADMRNWLSSGLSFGRVAVNLSHAEFTHPGFADDLLRALDASQVPTQYLEVEITEKVLLDGRLDAVSSVLKTLCDQGIKIALDDFGTGYASLTHLKRFPVDHIKIDRSFVQDLEQDSDDEAIVAAVIGLGRSLKLQITAEGVETAGQAQRLQEMGCEYAQGFYFAQPVAGSDVPDLMSRWGSKAA